MKKTWSALLMLIVSALALHYLGRYLPNSMKFLVDFLYLVVLLVFGYFMSPTKKRNNRWVGKVLISLVVIFIFGARLNWFRFDEFLNILAMLGLTNRFLDLLLIYCGWVFFQV